MCGYRSMGPRARAKLGAPGNVSCGRMMHSRIKSASGGELKGEMWSCFHTSRTSRIGLLPCNFAKFGGCKSDRSIPVTMKSACLVTEGIRSGRPPSWAIAIMVGNFVLLEDDGSPTCGLG